MKINLRRIVQHFFEIGSLRKIVRSHRQTILMDDLSDNIAAHSYRVTMIGWMLADLEGADSSKVIKLCLLHDIPEARSGDQNWVHKHYVKVYEEEIIKDQLKGLPNKEELEALYEEYEKRESLESKVAKDADLLDQTLLLKEHEQLGNREATRWLASPDRYTLLSTDVAKRLHKEIVDAENPGDWWYKSYSSSRR